MSEPDELYKFRLGDRVCKTGGYAFDGIVVAGFMTSGGRERYVVEFIDRAGEVTGLCHIFSAEQLRLDPAFDEREIDEDGDLSPPTPEEQATHDGIMENFRRGISQTGFRLKRRPRVIEGGKLGGDGGEDE